MKFTRISIWYLSIVLELTLATVGGLIFVEFVKKSENFFGRSYVSGALNFYGGISLVFFIAVLIVGVTSTIILKQSYKLRRALVNMLMGWVVAIFVFAFTESFFSHTVYWIPMLIIAGGIIVGFNLKMRPDAYPKNRATRESA